ncbi:CRISPR-associated protein Cas6 [Carboxydocella sp. ULO1]|nr:CRISPR-associated protein Cas6 [Carboxydocella sp. ULO1]
MKHIKLTPSHLHNVRFEPTYEELKLAAILPIGTLKSCFEPTYEELKRKNFNSVSVAPFAF